MVQYLLDNGGDLKKVDENGDTALHLAASLNSNVEVTRLFLDRGADIKAVNKHGNTPLHDAARQNGNIEISRLLIERWIILNAVNKSYRSFITSASINPNPEVVRLFEEKVAEFPLLAENLRCIIF